MNKENKKESENKIYGVLSIAIFFVIFSFLAPYLFIKKPCIFNKLAFTENTGQTGDTIGGIMNPFISIAAVIVTGLAFYMQYQANKIQIDAFKTQKEQFDKDQKRQIAALDLQKKQFEEEREEQRKNIDRQKFENQFYERLRLHKENVNEMEVEMFDEVVKGRTVFSRLLYSLNLIYKNVDCKKYNRVIFEENVYPEFYSKYGNEISHYFRHLFHTVKFVVDSKEKEIINEKQKKEYFTNIKGSNV